MKNITSNSVETIIDKKLFRMILFTKYGTEIWTDWLTEKSMLDIKKVIEDAIKNSHTPETKATMSYKKQDAPILLSVKCTHMKNEVSEPLNITLDISSVFAYRIDYKQ